MGVPGFFAWLIKSPQTPKIVNPNLEEVISKFYLDFNCMIHPVCQKVISELVSKIDNNKLETLMIKEIIKNLDHVIELVNAQEYTFIAIDGVAPLAKINQQRKRRGRSIEDTYIKNKIKAKYNKEIYTNWSGIVITPGTVFMEKLHLEILKYIASKKKRKIIYSSYHTPGEGEHKILQDIRKNKQTPCVIYGLDADLIFLALASQRSNIYLMREDNQVNKKEEFETYIYVSIDNTKVNINNQVGKIISNKFNKLGFIDNNNNYDFVSDFIFICYLLGNDFLPHFQSIDIKTNGLDFLLDCYGDIYCLCQTTLINNSQINESFFRYVFKKSS